MYGWKAHDDHVQLVEPTPTDDREAL